MIDGIVKINFEDYSEGFPAFLTIIMMTLTGSIGDGLMIGIIFYTLTKFVAKRFKEVSPFILVLSCIFIFKYLYHKQAIYWFVFN